MSQLLISLFTTGGRPNPVAIALIVLTAFGGLFGYHKFTVLSSELSAARDCRIIQTAQQEKIKILNEARNDQQEANTAIDSGDFNDWLERMQQDY